jgi:intracellular sulfur oxidation DsrE/DsrF family protein
LDEGHLSREGTDLDLGATNGASSGTGGLFQLFCKVAVTAEWAFMRLSKLSFFLAVIFGGSGPAFAGPEFPAIGNFGGIHNWPNAAERPDSNVRYRVLFDITKQASAPDQVSPTLEKVARFLNLLAADDVRPKRGDVVAIVHGSATPVVLNNEAYRKRYEGSANPNLQLIAQLREAGVTVRVCSQALSKHEIQEEEVTDAVQIDVAALTTLANLQLRGYALIPE